MGFRRIIKESITEFEWKKLIGEGLIKTHNPKQVVDILNRFVNKTLDVKLHKEEDSDTSGIILVYFKEDFKKTKIDELLSFMNNMGYYPAGFFSKTNMFTKTYQELGDDLYSVRFEPKFDTEYIPQDRYMYHITDGKHIEKIMRIGLTPKTKSKALYHPERIYLTKTINDALNIKTIFSLQNLESDYGLIVLKIDLQNLFIHLREDSQFKGGVYTTDNIPPNHIQVVDLKKTNND
ncbi:MAG: hypothetical protein ACK5OW_00540 [bacterium]|jgi:hypothetical protein